ncbi:hypothetical protein LguiB_016991 [Lonicera macranthoides]
MQTYVSCIKVALDFVSPESIHDCIRLADEFRALPRNHVAKEDKLEAKKMALHAIKQAVETLAVSTKGDDEGLIFQNETVPIVDCDEEEDPSLCSDETSGDNEHDDIEGPVARHHDLVPHDEFHHVVVPVVKMEPFDTATPAHADTATDAITATGGPSRGRMAPWEGHMVLEPYVDLLSHMKKEHPETFCHYTIRSASMQTKALNLLGAAYVSFAKKPLTAMEVEDISRYRDLFSDLEQHFKFDLSWLRERVDRIEKVRFNSSRVGGELVALGLCIEARERELAELKGRYHAKTEEVRAAHKWAGDGLLIGWTPR